MMVVVTSLLLQLLKWSLVNGILDSECCFTKEVGGIRYELLGEEDTSAHMCKSNCAYREDSDPDSVYCFKAGKLPVSCIYQEAPVMTDVLIEEDGERIVQENLYHEDTGILIVKVPPHKNYSETMFLLHQDSNISMLKSSGICHITDLPDHIDISKLAQGYENNNKRMVRQSVPTYLLKARLARYGAKQRAELHPDASYLCKDAPLVKTDDTYLTKEEWEKLNNDEIITLDTHKSLRQQEECRVASSVSRVDPNACGYAWINPAGGGLSTHEVTQAGLKVNCLLDAGCGDNLHCKCDDESRIYCQCKGINDDTRNGKAIFQYCYYLGRDVVKTIFQAGNQRTTFIQQMAFKGHIDEDGVGPAVVITSPANSGHQGLTVVMNGYQEGHWHYNVYYNPVSIKNNMMLKLGDVCHIRTLPSDIFPGDIASGIVEIKEENDSTAADEEEIERVIILPGGILTQSDRNDLHPDIKETCKGASLEKYIPATEKQAEKLYTGEIIFLDFVGIFKSALILDDQGSGSWRYPNKGSDKLWINQIVDLVIETRCCTDPAVCGGGGHEGGLCHCDQIKDKQSFEQCNFEL